MINIQKTVSVVLVSLSLSTFASEYSANTMGSEPAEDSTAKYLKTLGAYLGYDLDTQASPEEEMLSYTLSIISTGQQILNSFFQAIPVNALYKDFTTNPTYGDFNSQANLLFQDFKSAGSSGISVIDNFDQKDYQDDPVTQSVLNQVGTPDWSACSGESDCLPADQVMTTVLQDVTKDDILPGENDYFKYKDNNEKFISQLNSDNLISPLLYATSSSGGSSSSSSKGLPSDGQEQQAHNFILYATEAVIPLPTMTKSDYSTLFALAYPPTDSEGNYDSSVDANNTMNAKVGLAKYLLGLRVFAAKTSVAVGNLYSILSKRMPQSSTDSSGGNSTTTSQALNEFKMATWRQYNPEKQDSDQWASKINTSSPATIQKEMAILLSEISYQLYLNRQEQERILLTESMILLQMLSATKPSAQIPDNVDTGDTSTSS
jgi:intracellular multiplication protein IcmX